MPPSPLHGIPTAPNASRLFFGCASMGGRVGRRVGLRALAVAFEHGITGFDTARSYGYGDSERILGEFLKGRREQVFVSTKCGIASFRPSLGLRVVKDLARSAFAAIPALRRAARGQLGRQHRAGLFTPAQIRQSVEESLRELGTDRIDVLFLHDVTADAALDEEVLATLESLRSSGKILRFGCAGDPKAMVGILSGGSPTHTALQYPAGVAAWGTYPSGFPPPASSTILRLGNQPFVGALGSPDLRARIETALGMDLSERDRREILVRAPVVMGVCDALVTSMMTPEHIIENVGFLTRPTLDVEQIRAAVAWGDGTF